MKKITQIKISIFITLILALIITYIYYKEIWNGIEKIGALATAFALLATSYQSFVAWKTANFSKNSNAQNFFQQKFNLILEQHNNALNLLRSNLKENKINYINTTTLSAIEAIRCHDDLSPYMRILYHTLKCVREELPLFSEHEVNESISYHKKYTSLVRSFIPNDILYYIALNASVYDDRYFKIPESQQYEPYYNMLRDYDFFEHLVFKDKKPYELEGFFNNVRDFIYLNCNQLYLYNLTPEKYAGKPKLHTSKINELLYRSDLFICLAYDLKNPKIITPEHIDKNKNLPELVLSCFLDSKKSYNPEDLLDSIIKDSDYSDEYIIKNALENENIVEYHCDTNGFKRLSLYELNPLNEWLIDSLSLKNPYAKLLDFKKNIRKKLTVAILTHHHLEVEHPIFKISTIASRKEIIKSIAPILDEKISLRKLIEFDMPLEKVLNENIEEVEMYIRMKLF